MLLNNYKKTALKKVSVVTRNPKVTLLLGAILEDWGFVAITAPEEAALVFVERGMDRPSTDGEIVWFSSMPLAEEAFLEMPLSLTCMYHLLEEEFFPSPRRHIRVSMDCPADLQVDGIWEEATLISLSDRGGRLRTNRELPRGTVVAMEVKLAGRTLRLPGEILYCIPAGDSFGREKPQAGILFKPLDQTVCTALRRFIESTCVQRVCDAHQFECSNQTLSWIELAQDPWADLE